MLRGGVLFSGCGVGTLTRLQAARITWMRMCSFSTEPVPDRFRDIVREVGNELNMQDTESIKLTVRPDTMYSITQKRFPPVKVLGISEFHCFPDRGREKLKKLLLSLAAEGKAKAFSIPHLKMVYGLDTPDHVLKFIIAHELSHMKMKHHFFFSTFRNAWMLGTAGLTSLLWTYLPDFAFTDWEVLLRQSDFLMESYVFPMGLLWGSSYALYRWLHNRSSRDAEFQADRMAGELSPQTAQAGIEYITALSTFAKIHGFDRKPPPGHPTCKDRIEGLKRVLAVHEDKGVSKQKQ